MVRLPGAGRMQTCAQSMHHVTSHDASHHITSHRMMHITSSHHATSSQEAGIYATVAEHESHHIKRRHEHAGTAAVLLTHTSRLLGSFRLLSILLPSRLFPVSITASAPTPPNDRSCNVCMSSVFCWMANMGSSCGSPACCVERSWMILDTTAPRVEGM